MTRSITPLLCAACLAAAPALGAEQRLELDAEATHVSFDVAATGHDVHGTLYLQRGSILFDPATGEASGEIAIDARRAETGGGKRDRDMHAKVLESETYPLFVFTAEGVEGELVVDGTSELTLDGTLAIHGEEHPLTLPATVTLDGDEVSAEVAFEVPYVAWGMHNPSLLFLRVAEVVDVTVDAHGTLRPASELRAAVDGSR